MRNPGIRYQLTRIKHILGFRKRGDSVRLASDAYFFEEGQWETDASARFGQLRVSDDGNAVLTGMHDRDGKRVEEPLD